MTVAVTGSEVLDGGFTKTPLAQSLTRLATAKAQDLAALQGLSLPCTVSQVTGTIDDVTLSPWIVQINFEVSGKTLPRLVVPVLAPPYIAYPIQVGDAGVALAATARLGGLSGLGSGTPAFSDLPGNLSCLGFVWLGKTSFATPDPAAICLLEPTGNCNLQVAPTGVTVEGPNGNLYVKGNLGAGNGATGQFTTPSGQTVMVQNGIITNIY
jgi:hypothetical protein